jgi:hypothetical protein
MTTNTNTAKDNVMTYTIDELTAMLETAYAQRKQAYKIRAPKFVTTAINNQIFDIKQMLIIAEGN